METFSALLAICAGNSPVNGEFPTQRPVTRSFDVFFDLRPNERLSKQSWGWWFETLSSPLWRHRNESFHKILLSLVVQDSCFRSPIVLKMDRNLGYKKLEKVGKRMRIYLSILIYTVSPVLPVLISLFVSIREQRLQKNEVVYVFVIYFPLYPYYIYLPLTWGIVYSFTTPASLSFSRV